MRRPLALLVSLAALALPVAGCGGSSAGSGDRTVTVTETVFTTPGKSVPVPASGPLTTEGYQAITAGLRKLLGRDPLLLEMGLYENYAWFRVYDRTTGYADDYSWRDGVFAPPQPFKVGSTDVDRDVFALEEVPVAGPAAFVKAMGQIQLEGAGDDSPSVIIDRNYSGDDQPGPIVMRAGLDGTRQYLSLLGDKNGRIIEKHYS